MDESDNTPPEGLHPAGGMGQSLIKQKRVSYKKMISEAIEALKERRGSTRQSILKFISSKYHLGRGGPTRINSMITKMFKNRKLLRTRGTLEDGAFKLNVSHQAPFASAGRSRRGRSRGKRRKRKGKRKTRRGRRAKRRRKKGKRRGKKRRGKKRRVRRGRAKRRQSMSFLHGL